MKKIKGFTFVEVMITLVIIGVIFALTLPSLISKINDKISENQSAVINSKLVKGLNLTKTAGDLNDTYESTYDFLKRGLSKNLKMVSICDSENIKNCVPYEKIKYDKFDKSEGYLDVSELKTADKLRLSGGFKDIASFVLADGTVIIASYNLECVDDPDFADKSISPCLAGIYDVNGSRRPNKFGYKTEIKDGKTVKVYSDLKPFNGASLGCISTIDNICIISSALGRTEAGYNNMLSQVQAVQKDYVMPRYFHTDNVEYNDYWQLSVDYCQKVKGGKLPSLAQLNQIADKFYSDVNDTATQDGIRSSLGIMRNAQFELWSSEKVSPYYCTCRAYYYKSTAYWTSCYRKNQLRYAVCIGE